MLEVITYKLEEKKQVLLPATILRIRKFSFFVLFYVSQPRFDF